ncbi:hypothetical protein HYU95_00680 [Candidatus Daviesbacteria bacterium]|nr:hypothetical protein [Candidatus Daviesbacteria bacterium]
MKPLLLILISVGLLWLKSSLGKIASGNFVSNLGVTLGKTAEKNPYPFFKDFLTNVAIPNSQIFGFLVMWGEFLSAIAITLGAFLLLVNPKANKLVVLMLIGGLIGGAFLNINFWFGFGYSNPSTDSLNLLMAVVEIIGVFTLLKNFTSNK